MKINITIAFFLIGSFCFSQNKTIKLFGSGGYDFNGNTERRMNGSDTIYTVSSQKFKLFRPLRLGEFTISSLPSAASCAGCIVVVPDSSYKPYISDSATWKELEGSGGGGGSLPTKPGNYLLRGTGAAGYDTATGLYYNNVTKMFGIGTTVPTHPMTFDKVNMVDNGGIAMYSTTDQTTNYQRFRINMSAGNNLYFNLEKGGTGTYGYYTFKINGAAVLELDNQNATFYDNFFFSPDNTKNIGRLSAAPYRPKSIYVGTDIQVGLPANTTTTALVHIAGSTASKASMRIEPGTPPTTPNQGDFYVKTADNKPYYYDGTSEYDLTATNIADHSISNAKLVQMAANSIKGNNIGSTGDQKDLTVSEVKTMLGVNNITSGAFDATITAGTNVSSVSSDYALYQRIGNVVTVYQYVLLNITTADITSTITSSLPVVSDFATTVDAIGSGMFNAEVASRPSTDDIIITFTPSTTGSLSIRFSYSYYVTPFP